MVTRVLSIGYEKRSVSELVSLLATYKIEKLIDVRELPLSRRKGFSKTKLSASLSRAGIQYQHVKQAGNPHRKLKANIKRCLSLYEGYLERHHEVIDLMKSEMQGSSVAILCYERNHCDCHRSVLLKKMGNKSFRMKIVEA